MIAFTLLALTLAGCGGGKGYSAEKTVPAAFTVTVDSWSSDMSQNMDKADSIALDLATEATVTVVALTFKCKAYGATLGSAFFQAHGFAGYSPDGAGALLNNGASC